MIHVDNAPYSLDDSQVLQRLKRFEDRYPEVRTIIGGAPWRYRRSGGSTRPLIMWPGIQGGGEVFFEVVLELGEVLDIITVTAPPISQPEEMAQAHATFMDALRLDRASMFGTSLGGSVLQVFCIRYPQRVAQVFLSNTFADATPYLAKLPPASAVSAQRTGDSVRKSLAAITQGTFADPGQRALQRVLNAIVGSVQTAEEVKSRMTLLRNSVPIGRIPIPMEDLMIIDSDDDPAILPEMRLEIRTRYADADRYEINGGGHYPAIQRPAGVIRAIRSRLNQLRVRLNQTRPSAGDTSISAN